MILFCFGTRPEWLKLKPLLESLPRDSYRTLFTGQHVDLLNSISMDYAISMSRSDNRLDQIISDCLTQFPETECDKVLVQGDTASAFACAVAAFHRQKELYYLEAGLRSYDLRHPYPEEGYRQMIARLADINLCPTELSKSNLEGERAVGSCHVVGNTVLDNLIDYKSKCEYQNKVLVTMHRRENHHIMKEWFGEINALAQEHSNLEFVLPIHPNPNVTQHRGLLTHVNVVEPLPYDELLNLLAISRLVITDSGGLQEEGTFLNKKVIVCRQTTERPEGIETGHLHMCKAPDELQNIFKVINKDYTIDSPCPYGDGYSSKKIKDIIC